MRKQQNNAVKRGEGDKHLNNVGSVAVRVRIGSAHLYTT